MFILLVVSLLVITRLVFTITVGERDVGVMIRFAFGVSFSLGYVFWVCFVDRIRRVGLWLRLSRCRR